MEFNLATTKKVFFVGIGGIGISAIARMMLEEGKEVFGSDMTQSELTDELVREGARISIGQNFDLISKDTDLIIYTTAIKHYDPALLESIMSSGITAKSYPEMLHIVTANKNTIAVSGTHGKTTTTAMIAKILITTKKDPSVIVGSLLKEYNSNFISGKGEHFVVEACEYDRSFLNIEPKILVVTNIESDHLDYYKDLADIEHAFTELCMQTGNAVVCDPNDESVKRMLSDVSSEKGLKVIDYTKYIEKVPKLFVPGEHNRKNAAAALAVADALGIPMEEAANAVAEFQGTWRRLELRGSTAEGAIIYDDYAHHPTEILASLSALRELYPKGKNKIIVLFQPHLYSRTKAFFEGFTTAFNEADEAYFLPIFFAREEPDPTVSSERLAEAVGKGVPNAKAFSGFSEAEEFFRNASLKEGDIFVTMGAGEAYKVGDYILALK
ncbi:MAG: UDP-N-acetylmuramate--L-alanine ligase [Candidatus Pacebacteria bacterium]|nr:UDP-N-acetylmuramate--L-alanine ligase [Candidatus Paceibacterota bacterium]